LENIYVCIPQEEAKDIVEILNGIIEDEDCFAKEVGTGKCLHCRIERLLDGGLMVL